MKHVWVGVVTTLLLMGAGCVDGRNVFVPFVDTAGPAPSLPDADPEREVQINWADLAYAAQANNCGKFRAYLSSRVREGMSDADCAGAFAAYAVYIPIDWAQTTVGEDGQSVTLFFGDGTVFGTYMKEADGAWYLDTAFWE